MALRCYRGIRRAWLTDIERRGVGNRRWNREDSGEVVIPVFGEEQTVVEQLRNFTLDAQVEQHGARPSQLLVPPCLWVGLKLFWKKLGFTVVEISGGDNKVRTHEVGGPGLVHILDTGCPSLASTAALRADSAHGCVGQDGNPCVLNDFAHGIHDANKPALGIENTIFHVQVAHQVEHAWRDEGARAEENSRIAQKLLNTGALRVLLGEGHNRRGQ